MIADARDSESVKPPYPGLAEFLAAQTILNQQGQEVRTRHVRTGALAVAGAVTITDILLGRSNDARFTFNLQSGAYELHSIWALANPVNEESFFLYLTGDQKVSVWQKVPQTYGSDANHMAFIPTAQIDALRTTLDSDPRVWNAMCNLVCAYREKEAKIFAERGFSFASPSGDAAPFLIAPMAASKIATLYLGLDERDRISGLQARIR